MGVMGGCGAELTVCSVWRGFENGFGTFEGAFWVSLLT